MLPLHELERLAARYRQDRDRRLMGPRASQVRDKLARGCRELAQAADAIGEFTKHELALVGTTKGEAQQLLELLESWSARSGAAACEVGALGLNGRRRWADYIEPPAKFMLVREIADRLDALGVPLGDQVGGALWDTAHEALYLAGEDEPSRWLSKVVADVLAARKDRASEGGVRELMVAAE